MIGKRTMVATLVALVAAGVMAVPREASARVPRRNVKIEFNSSSGFAMIHNNLKVYENGDAELTTGRPNGGSKTVLHLSSAEYTSLVNAFTKGRFTSMPESFEGPWVPDGPSYLMTYRTTRGTTHTVRSHMGAKESRGFVTLKNRMYRLMSKVREQGRNVGAQVVDASMNGKTIEAKVGDTIEVKLDGNATAGYSWKAILNTRSLPAQGPTYKSSSSAVGSGGTYTFVIRPDRFAAGGTHKFKFAYFRSWEGPEKAAKTFSLTVKVAPVDGAPESGATRGPGIIDGLEGR